MTTFVKSVMKPKLKRINFALMDCSMTPGLLYMKLRATQYSRLLFPNLQSRGLARLMQITPSSCMIL